MPPVEENDSSMIFKVPENGILETSTEYNDFANFSDISVHDWINYEGENNQYISPSKYGYFQTRENYKVDTVINANGEKRFVRKRSAKDFNYVCFYVIHDTTVVDGDSLVNSFYDDQKDCSSFIEKRRYFAY